MVDELRRTLTRPLDLLSKVYQPALAGAVAVVASGSLPAGPLVVDLDPTTACDLDCPECISSNVLHNGSFSRERLLTLGKELVDIGTKGVVLIGGGEPLMHPATKELMWLLSDSGIKVGLVTNGTLLHRYLFEVDQCLEWVRVSVDAATEGTYDEFRPARRRNSVFRSVIENISRVSGARCSVGYSFVTFSRKNGDGSYLTNVTEIYDAAVIARGIGCNYLELKASLDSNHFIQRPPEYLMEEIKSQIDKATTLCTQGFSVLVSSSLKALLSASGTPVQPKTYHRCLVSRLRTTISPLGVFLCAYHRGQPFARLGDPLNESMVEIWKRALHHTVDPSINCSFHCARNDINLHLETFDESETVEHSDLDDIFI